MVYTKKKDIALLEKIKSFFGVGEIFQQTPSLYCYRVSSIKEILIIINHFNKFPLLTQKRADYELFKQAFSIVLNKEHLTEEGLHKIVAIKAKINLGLSNKLKTAFPDIPSIDKPLVQNQTIDNSQWLAGFASAEGCYRVNLLKSPSNKLGERVILNFILTQHYRDKKLMRNLVEYFNCGNLYKNRQTFNFIVAKFLDITDKIIPFFQKYTLEGVKSKDFEDFCKIAELVKNKAHLTQDGLETIRKIKAGMNVGRE